ncbi:uncharacterized protein LOC119659079 [Hermetia illucens]|uniref:uncharacterized protein LOC119659079 n=1 Tax=Hermetia illucens TaxID=343691 RepID=UPI0018CC409E|nr:uncharacterized protein LOC119659079 [Hermetia illucens]
MLKGPTMQDDLLSMLLRFRKHKFAFSADIEKMYRQVNVSTEDSYLQLIVWRDNPNKDLRYYRLKTVTYGITAAPYLATRCLVELANTSKKSHLLASSAIKDFYVDDVMTGSNSLKEAVKIQDELKTLLQSAGFNLRKWCANDVRLLSSIPSEDREEELSVDDSTDEGVKTLGFTGNPKLDHFRITTVWNEPTKELWSLKLDWDEAIPMGLHTRWLQFRQELADLNRIRIPRYLETKNATVSLHAFSDASERAYGVVIYLRSINNHGDIKVRLLCSKSRVATVKPITLPRLELCAATLMARLTDRVTKILNMEIGSIHYWTDSQIVLAWTQSRPSSFHTFVANRMSSIQELTNTSNWRYVNTKHNPADLVSRGARPSELINSKIWFQGHEFLSQPEISWPCEVIKEPKDLPEQKTIRTVLTTSAVNDHFIDRIDHRNSFTHLKRIIATVLRAIQCFKGKRVGHRFLSVAELEEALTLIIRHMQVKEFKAEIKQLRRERPIDSKSKFTKLTPFLDNNSIIRVGGRLQNASIPYTAKHPAILPTSHPFTKLLLVDLHKDNLHIATQALRATAWQQFWILRDKGLASAVVHECVQCSRLNPQTFKQLMGTLPDARVQPARPFINVGIDFCGPVFTHCKIRGKRLTKIYMYLCILLLYNQGLSLRDLDYAAYLEGEIEKSRASEHYLHTLMKNQISLLETTTNLFKRKRNHIQEQFKAIHDYLKQLSGVISSVTQQQIFTTFCIRTMMALQTYQDTQRALWDIMLDLQHGTINPLLVKPQQHQQQITLIQKTVPPNLRIPISRTIGDLSLYKTFSISAEVQPCSPTMTLAFLNKFLANPSNSFITDKWLKPSRVIFIA